MKEIKAPRPEINVTDDHFERGIKQSTTCCAVQLAFQEQCPWAKSVLVDLQTIRASDPAKGLRYIWFTPNIVMSAIIAWDYGVIPKPFSFRLRGAQVISMRTPKRNGRKLAHKLGRRKTVIAPGDGKKRMRRTIIGGTAPPTNAFSSHRTFGRKGLRVEGVKHPFELLQEAAAK